jgi:hypothetical protein
MRKRRQKVKRRFRGKYEAYSFASGQVRLLARMKDDGIARKAPGSEPGVARDRRIGWPCFDVLIRIQNIAMKTSFSSLMPQS